MSEVHVEGLLHLAAVAVALKIAYIGLDKVHKPETLLVDSITNESKKIRELIVNKLDVPQDNRITIPTHYDVRALHMLCYIADIKAKRGI